MASFPSKPRKITPRRMKLSGEKTPVSKPRKIVVSGTKCGKLLTRQGRYVLRDGRGVACTRPTGHRGMHTAH